MLCDYFFDMYQSFLSAPFRIFVRRWFSMKWITKKLCKLRLDINQLLSLSL